MNAKRVYLYCIVGIHMGMDVHSHETIAIIYSEHVDQQNSLDFTFFVNHQEVLYK
jgi:hypothetical protein